MTESGITLTFPDANYFRFQDCRAYQSLSGYYFKEMDVCWYEAATDIYWLIELKDYRLANLKDAEGVKGRAWDIAKKAVDTLNMFLSCQHNYPLGVGLLACMSYAPVAGTKLNVITIVQCDNSQNADIQLLSDAFKIRFKAYAQLFNINLYSVMSYVQAVRFLNHIVS